jgi:cardiolipin synthase A/B
MVTTPSVRPPGPGTSSGAHILPGSDDDGWIVPPPVTLFDGTSIQLYKDGEAWRAAFDFLKDAHSRICLEVYIFASDDLGRAVSELLCEKARRGVAV